MLSELRSARANRLKALESYVYLRVLGAQGRLLRSLKVKDEYRIDLVGSPFSRYLWLSVTNPLDTFFFLAFSQSDLSLIRPD